MSRDTQKSNAARQINENIKLVYDQAAKEELPEAFKDLIAKLKAQEDQRDER